MKPAIRTFLSVIFFLTVSQTCHADILDSLLNVLKTRKSDTNKVKTLIDIGWEYSYTDVKQTEPYAEQALSLSEKLNYTEGKALSFDLIGIANRSTSNYTKAIDYFRKALQIRIQLGQIEKQAKVYVNLANVYLDKADYSNADHYYNIAIEQANRVNAPNIELIALTNLSAVHQNLGDYGKALDCLLRALQINKKLKDEIQEAFVYANISIIYQKQNQFNLAIDYNLKALEIFKRNNREDQQAVIYNSLGIIYKSLGNYDLALKNYNESLLLYKKIGSDATADMIYHNIGIVYFNQKKYDKALEYQNASLESAVKSNDEFYISRCMMSIAEIYSAKGDFKKAKEYAVKGLALNKKQDDKDEIRSSYATLSNIYLTEKDFEKAFYYLDTTTHLSEEMNNDDVNKRIGQMQAMYEADKKQKEIELLTKDKEIQDEKIVRQNIINYAVFAGLILVLIVAFILNKRYREKKKANIEITSQKEIIEIKNKEILDSIHYAKRIQRALLASDNLLAKNLPEYFILYKPKDIVSGDFYWAQNTNDTNFLLATCDCTGHGVPGAFMSLLNTSKLNETVIEKKIMQPDLIFNQVRDEIIKALNSDQVETVNGLASEALTKDGMDAILCSFDFKNNKLQFAAANNPLIIIRNKEILEYKADKFPIGVHQGELKPFTLTTVDIQKGDCIYTFTDGYADQFGGGKGKKLMSKKFKEILASIVDKPLEAQKKELDRIFEDWRGTLEQVDDVLVIGIRV